MIVECEKNKYWEKWHNLFEKLKSQMITKKSYLLKKVSSFKDMVKGLCQRKKNVYKGFAK
jgi:hypothetical protein